MTNYVFVEKELQILKKELGHTKPNKDGEVKEYAKLCLFDRDNAIVFNVFCFDFDRYAVFEENSFEKFKIKVTAKDGGLDFFLC